MKKVDEWLLRVVRILAIPAILISLQISAPAGEVDLRRPNVVFMLADDLGWADTTVYGSTLYETPHIARLAKQGLTFTNAYAASPLCSPTRASILTGQYPGRLRLTTPACHLPQEVLDPQVPDRASPHHHVVMPETRTRLPNDYVTYAEVLKTVGYRTAFLGKWHLGREPYLPESQGFDVVVGGRHHPGPPGGYFAPWPCETLPRSPDGAHIDDAITTEAIKFLETNRQRPFLLNLWFYSVHAPFEAKQPLIEKYRAKAKADPTNLQTNPVMGAMIETLDDNVGRVLDALERLGLSENTLVIFTSDNGGNMYNFVEGVEATNNAPLRNGKGNIYDGGHRVPLIVSWPGKIAQDERSDAIVSSVDYFPTILDVAGLPRPEEQACDGASLWPVLQGGRPDPARAVFCHFPHMPPATGSLPATSVRQGDWKLLRFYGDASEGTDRLELYRLADDPGESRNLAGSDPQRAADLNALVEKHLADTQALVPK
ncbi:MAG TPA: sulfatase, partial [Thermoguttaceae bacterium]|nr:sulfatase [Thermoguttaceae bacterium]